MLIRFRLFEIYVTLDFQTTFMLTESAKSRNRTLFFRQDDWDAVCKPLLATLQRTMFEEVPKVRFTSLA